jgi:RNA methyltransferase, TrmH family
MARRPYVSSTANQRLRAVRRLARRPSPEVVLVEGSRPLQCALDACVHVRELYVSPALFLGDADALLVERAERDGARIVEVDPDTFAGSSRRIRPDGVLAVVERPSTELAHVDLPPEPFVLVVEAIERPGNLGTILRTASAAGTACVVVADPRTDVFHRDVVRGSIGAVFHARLAVATTAEALAWLRRQGLFVVAATPSGATPYAAAQYPAALAIALGSERHGLSAPWLEAADERVAIPMAGPVDSLNVGVAAGILLFDAALRRSRAFPER